jgi:hypothetical protein
MAHAVVTPAPFRKYLSPVEVEAVFGISPRTLEFWRREGRGPSFVRLVNSSSTAAKCLIGGWSRSKSRWLIKVNPFLTMKRRGLDVDGLRDAVELTGRGTAVNLSPPQKKGQGCNLAFEELPRTHSGVH